MLALGNLSGRLGWSALSDKIGRRTTFQIFTLGSIPLCGRYFVLRARRKLLLIPAHVTAVFRHLRYLSVPWLVDLAVSSPSIAPGIAFVGTTAVAVTMMGGAYATLPAYEADLFGPKCGHLSVI